MRISSRAALPVVAVGSLILGLSAPALGAAASHLINGSSIKPHSIAGNRLKGNTLTGAQINESTLGTVPSAKVAKAAESAPLPRTLAKGQTETGVWQTQANPGTSSTGTISFPVPLDAAPTYHIVNEAQPPTDSDPAGCTGTAANPGAKPGNLCIFFAAEYGATTVGGWGVINPTTGDEGSASRFGVTVFADTASENIIGGSWAVTAP